MMRAMMRWLIGHLDNLCISHWLFVLISLSIIPTERRVQKFTNIKMMRTIMMMGLWRFPFDFSSSSPGRVSAVKLLSTAPILDNSLAMIIINITIKIIVCIIALWKGVPLGSCSALHQYWQLSRNGYHQHHYYTGCPKINVLIEQNHNQNWVLWSYTLPWTWLGALDPA